ncbi:MAG: hypothetical protein K2X38_23455 [Gemmataceae bacterium]|nr:hypothetical protein [Gemmataceae bacterium]
MNVPANRFRDFSPELLPDREEAYLLKEVWERGEVHNRSELVLDFGDCSLHFGVDIDTDQIVPDFRPGAVRKSKSLKSLASLKPWRDCVGKEIGWTWLATNQQGYMDSAMISFVDVIPMILLHAMASSVEVFSIMHVTKNTQESRKAKAQH